MTLSLASALQPNDLHDIVVLLDDQLAPAHAARSRIYRGLAHCLSVDGPDALWTALEVMQQGLSDGLYAVLLLDYELGEELQGLPPRTSPRTSPHTQPQTQPQTPTPSDGAFSHILLFSERQYLTAPEVDTWLDEQCQARAVHQTNTAHPPVLTGWQPNVTEAEFEQAIATIHQRIESGDTYQVNLCFAVTAALNGDPVALYRALRQHQRVAYGALIGLPDGRWVLSRSPEQFVSLQDGWLQAQPMKGTADVNSALDLATDPKNQAENVMIVDLLRNDLGRLAVPGTVSVPQRFDVQRYGDVLQMTSTVRAKPRATVDWAQLLQALFPCGSITGAPKHRTMQIIRELEQSPRGLYTGAIGWIDPAASEQLNAFCLSVPIRTLTVSAPMSEGHRRVRLGVGAGITYSSTARDEWTECSLKARFVSQLVNQAHLFETMRANRQSGIAHLERHLARLGASARALGLEFDDADARVKLQAACAELTPDTDHRLRLDLHVDGHMTLTSAPIQTLQTPVGVLLAPNPMNSGDWLLRHKTTDRAVYDAAWQQAVSLGAFDMLFFNERDELTEGARSNVFVKLDGHWCTPPVTAGVLPGVMRSVLLDDAQLNARIATISRHDLARADDLMICNALRGALPAQIVSD